MDYQSIIDKYYNKDMEVRRILLTHSEQVCRKALQIVDAHPQLHADRRFVEEAAMLHDIGIIKCNAPGIYCFGEAPYICHGIIGAEMLRHEGYEAHARVCERHTGAGIAREQIERENLPLPHCDFLPVTIEEQIICFADKFFSKTHLCEEKTLAQAAQSIERFGKDGAERFRRWASMFC